MESHVGASNDPSLRYVIVGCAASIVPTHLQALARLPTAHIVGMSAAAESAGRILAVNFQQRFRPAIVAVRRLIEAGELGSLLRVLCVEPWFRPAAYYRSASWRGTWAGEGGGVLMNQAPHTLDLLCYLCGLPI